MRIRLASISKIKEDMDLGSAALELIVRTLRMPKQPPHIQNSSLHRQTDRRRPPTHTHPTPPPPTTRGPYGTRTHVVVCLGHDADFSPLYPHARTHARMLSRVCCRERLAGYLEAGVVGCRLAVRVCFLFDISALRMSARGIGASCPLA